MRFQYRGVEYRLAFQHNITTKKSGTRTINKLATTAYIRTGVRDQDETVVAEGTFTRYGKNAFSKETARQLALQQMLDNSAATFGLGNQNEFCSAVRTAYFTRPGGIGAKREVTIYDVARLLGCKNPTVETLVAFIQGKFAPKIANAAK